MDSRIRLFPNAELQKPNTKLEMNSYAALSGKKARASFYNKKLIEIIIVWKPAIKSYILLTMNQINDDLLSLYSVRGG